VFVDQNKINDLHNRVNEKPVDIVYEDIFEHNNILEKDLNIAITAVQCILMIMQSENKEIACELIAKKFGLK
jgi:hypothetical protein